MPSERPRPGKKKPVIPGWSESREESPEASEPRPKRKKPKRRENPQHPAPADSEPAMTEPGSRVPEFEAGTPEASPPTVSVNVDDSPASSESEPATTSTRSEPVGDKLNRWKKAAMRRPGVVAGVVVGLLLVVLLGDYVLRMRGGGNDGDGDGGIDRLAAGDVPLPANEAGVVRLYTKAGTGFVVLVDGEPVRKEDGEYLLTPCELVVQAGRTHRITVAKKGFRDSTKHAAPAVGEAVELIYTSTPDPEGTANSMLESEWFDAEVGQPIKLSNLNTPGKESDPFVTADGLTIYYVSAGLGGSAIHHASRSTPFEVFENPQPIPATNSFSEPHSPCELTLLTQSLDPNNPDVVKHLVYTTKSQVQSVVRRNVLRGFSDLHVFRYDPERTAPWTAAQMVDDGHALYWTASEASGPVTYFSARKGLDEEFDKHTLKVDVHGVVPSLSTDGLRLYAYDGRTLRRARRTSIYDWGTKKVRGREVPKLLHVPFSEFEDVVDLPIDHYRAAAGRRQFFVSADEQWMFYVDDPEGDGDLYAVRLRIGPGWGYRPRGKTIDDIEYEREPVIVAKEPDPGEKPFEPPKRVEDPREQPLAYTEHWKELQTLVGERKYDFAVKLIKQRYGDPAFADSRQLLDWDLADVERIRQMWQDAATGAASLQPGDTFKNKTVSLDFVEFVDGTLVGKVGDKTFTLELDEMHYTNVTAFVDRAIAEDDAEAQMRVATFLYFEPAAVERAVEARLDRAPERAESFTERIAGRMLAQAQQEFDRKNYRPGLAWLAKLREYAPDSDAAFRADDIESSLYIGTIWNRKGGRAWTGALIGEWAAGPDRAEDSWLVSPEPFDGFEMQMQYRTTSQQGSGGVFFRHADPDRPPYRNNAAFKIQLANDAGIAPDPFCTGALLNVQEPRKNAAKRMGEWNDFRMKVDGQKVQVWINDDLVLDTTAANSDIPLTGHVSLDGITGGITYRRILLLELPKRF